jgi:DNA-binding transcriptional LysR family regulator
MITFHKLRVFITVYERGSFNRAAGDLLLAQSAVSEHIADLEASFGVTLFTRTSNGVRPTPAGEVLYEYAGRLLALLAEAERAVLRVDEGRGLSIAATPGLSAHLLPPLLRQFQAQHPDAAVSLHTPLTAELLRDVLGGVYDLGFVEADAGDLPDMPSLGRREVRQVEYAVVVSRAHPWAARQTVTLAELARQPFINRLPTSRMRRWLEGLLAQRGVRLNTAAELDNPDAIRIALLNNMGVGVLPDYVTEREAASGELIRLHVDGLTLRRAVLLVWDARRPFTPVQRAFVRVVVGGDGLG